MYSKEEKKGELGLNKQRGQVSGMDRDPSPLLANSKYKTTNLVFNSNNKTNSLMKDEIGEIDLAALKR